MWVFKTALFSEPFPPDHHVFISKLCDDEAGAFDVFFVLDKGNQLALLKNFIACVEFRMWWSFDVIFFDP